uniref:cilia- and flagella-associated protein 74-like isoform X2 n=1 Tax=Styela clava TaxID=7725 RepID=UPI00193A4F38|nr:cilia- and flagella-associated protein 74-like isoform X2 [Styela clava]
MEEYRYRYTMNNTDLDLDMDEESESNFDIDAEFADLFSEPEEEYFTDGLYTEDNEENSGVSDIQAERSQLLLLRRHLDMLQEKMKNQEFQVLKAREELNACRTKIHALTEEQLNVKEEMETMKSIGNNASYFRLLSQIEKLSTEILNEKDVETIVKANLQAAELALSEVALEQRHYMDLGEKVQEQEKKVNDHKQMMAQYRLLKENDGLMQQRKLWRNTERLYNQQIQDAQVAYNEKMQDALINNAKARQFLQHSLEKIKRKQNVQDYAAQQFMEKKMKSIMELKKSISSTHENLKALQARDRARRREKKLAEDKERLHVLNEGGNPDQVILQRKKLIEQEAAAKAFAEKQNNAHIRIAEKILMEENRIKQRKKQQPQLWSTPRKEKHKELGPLKKRPVTNRIQLDKNDKPVFLDEIRETESHHASTRSTMHDHTIDFTNEDDDSELTSKSNTLSSPTSLNERLQSLAATRTDHGKGEGLARPEFQGLWTKKHKNYKVPNDDAVVPKPVGGSKMEKAILKKTLDKHRAGITVKQVAAGREFVGQPFYSKPDVIHFKDFDVGKTYQKRIVITNVSYTMNFCKFSGISEHLKDFINVEFKPPGQMSAGMSCDMNVTFTPMINEDLEGEVQFLAQTGPFSIPLKCSTKKCDLCLDVDFIDFGSQVVGETICRSVNLINKGALGTRFEFFKVPDKPATTYTTETSLGRLTTAETAAMTPVDESEFAKTATTMPQDPQSKQRRQTTKEGTVGMSTAPTAAQTADSFPAPFTGENERIQNVDIIEETSFADRDMLRSEGDEIKFASTVTDYSMLPEEIKVGQTMSGEIAAFSSVRLDVIFAPTIPGIIKANFRIAFSDKDSEPIMVRTTAKATDVPVWIEKQTVDLQICMYDRLYQDQLIVRNRATTALRLNFEVPKELRNHVELLPKTGYVQAQSTFTAQLKFLPRKNLAEEAAGLFDPETGILEAPMVIHVADQTRPVPFVVTAIVTSSDLEFEQDEINFGDCGIYESVTSTIRLTNHSILPQKFGFVDVPDYAEVQPNDGFGTILPLETIELDVIISISKAKNYDFKLTCKNSIGRSFVIRCKAVGVHPPLELTTQVLNFAATALGDTSCGYFHVVNSHVSANEFTHPVPRIGKGEIVPVGPTSFEFAIPDHAPISITPTVGTVMPGERCHITVHFSPTLLENVIREEAVHVFQVQREEEKKKEAERQAMEQALAATKVEEDKSGKGKKSKTPARSKTTESGHPKSGKSDGGRKSTSSNDEQVIPTPDQIEKDSIAYKAAAAALTRSHTGSFESFKIPCFVATGRCDDIKNPPSKTYHPADILYLDVHCPTVKPPVVVISNHGQNLTEFGQVSIGQNTIKPISIQNISDHSVDLTLSSLDTNGPFQVLNALRTLEPEETHTLLVSFTPNAGKLSYEVLRIISATSVLSVPLTGEGVSPIINVSVEDGILNLGDVLQGESQTSTFTLSNSSSLKVNYSVKLDSCSLLRHNLSQQFPDYVIKNLGKKQSNKMLAGPQNFDGSCVFDCVPCEGSIAPTESQEITVTFNPDHDSRHFSDGARIVLFNLEEAHLLHLKGRAHKHMMFVDGYDPQDVSVESLTVEKKPRDPESDAPEPVESILLTFRSKINEVAFPPVTRQLIIGCLRTNAFVAKKNGEWIFENLQHAQSLGFVVDPPKGVVDVDGTKTVDITWNPPEGHNPKEPVESSITLTLKADVPLTYNVLLRALLILH